MPTNPSTADLPRVEVLGGAQARALCEVMSSVVKTLSRVISPSIDR